MKLLPVTSITLAKPNVFCGFQRNNLPFIKHFESIIDNKGAHQDKFCPSAPFSCDIEFVCVRNFRAYAPAIQTHMRPPIAARAQYLLLSLFFSKWLVL
jgi:hypothetical protein